MLLSVISSGGRKVTCCLSVFDQVRRRFHPVHKWTWIWSNDEIHNRPYKVNKCFKHTRNRLFPSLLLLRETQRTQIKNLSFSVEMSFLFCFCLFFLFIFFSKWREMFWALLNSDLSNWCLNIPNLYELLIFQGSRGLFHCLQACQMRH